MPQYFLLLEAAWFHNHLKPALATSWRQRSFEPCRALCTQLVEAAHRSRETDHLPLDASTFLAVLQGLPFDRAIWRCLAGELFLHGAAELPLIQTAPETLSRLLAPGFPPTPSGSRESLPPIQQAHFGSRDVMIGAPYRPEKAGLNDTADVSRLADYLGSVNPDAWTTADLADLAELENEEERAAELYFVRDWFPALRQLYERAREREQVVVCEIP
jgi:hypothetical protein